MKYWPTKTPAVIRDQGLDWGPTLSKLGDPTIVLSVWSRLQGDAGFAPGAVDAEGRQTLTRVSGGTVGVNSVFRNTVTLSNALVLDEDVFQRIRA